MSLSQDAYSALLYLCSAYFIGANLSYGILLFFSWRKIKARSRIIGRVEEAVKALARDETAPPLTVVIPAFNEEKVIVETVRSYLTADYPNLEVIVVSDGATDGTVAALNRAFRLKPESPERKSQISEAPILRCHRSEADARLRVVEQRRSGKSNALNTGIDFAAGEIVVTTDADTIVESDALLKAALYFVEEPDKMVAVGGTLRISNGCVVEKGRISRGRLPTSALVRFQIIEYVRSFFAGRLGWDQMGATVLLSGAFAAFKRSALVEVGGFSPTSITEDLEIIVRLRRRFHEWKRPCLLRMIPEPLCWTQVPDTIHELRKQRIRWQQGLIDTLRTHWKLLFNPAYRSVGLAVMPYNFIFEFLGPFVELCAYFVVFDGLATGRLRFDFVSALLVAGILYCVFVALVGVYLEESHFARHHSRKSLNMMIVYSVLEIFGYRQLNWLWRLEAAVRMPFYASFWGRHERRGFREDQA